MDCSPRLRTRVATFVQRWCVVYLLLYVVPFPFDFFPLDRVPGITAGLNALLIPWNALVAWIENLFLDVPFEPRSYAATDNLHNYVGLCCLVALAALLAVAWPLVTRTREPSSCVLDRSRAYAALFLGAQLLVYGWSKMIPTQMPEPGPDRLIIPVGDMSPTGVLWTFMGLSPGYQMLCGLVETLGGTLLFWRRTRQLGALLAAVAMGNVVALNFGYDVPLKLFSTHLLMLALFVLGPDLRRLLAVLLFAPAVAARPQEPHPIARPSRRWAAWALKLALLLAISIHKIVVCVEFILTRGAFAPDGPLHGVYHVESFTRDGVADLPDHQRWLRVGINRIGVAAIQRADGHATRYSLQIDETRRSLTFAHPGRFVMHYTEAPDGVLHLVGTVDHAETIAVLRKQPKIASPTNFSFRWTQNGFVNH